MAQKSHKTPRQKNKMINPFQILRRSNNFTDEQLFIAREQELHDIFDALVNKQSVWITGSYGSGKTTLLNMIEVRAPSQLAPDFKLLRIDLSLGSDEAKFFDTLAQFLGLPLSSELNDLKRVLSEQQVLLLIDEFGLANQNNGFSQNFFMGIQSFIESTKLQVVIASNRMYEPFSRDSRFMHRFVQIKLGVLSKEAARTLLQKTAHLADITFTNSLITKAVELTRGQPVLLQIIGFTLVETNQDWDRALLQYNKLIEQMSERVQPADSNVRQPSAFNIGDTSVGQSPSNPPTSEEPTLSRSAQRTFLIQSGKTRIDIYFGGRPSTLVPWELDVDALVLPVGTLGSLTGKMADGFLDALGQQDQVFRDLLDTKRQGRQPTQDQPEYPRFIEPETPLLLDTEERFPNIKPRYIIAATAYRRNDSPSLYESSRWGNDIDENQDTLEVVNSGDAADAIIRLAAEENLSRVAIPLLGTGAAGLTSIDVAREMLAAIRDAVLNTSIQIIILLTRDWGAYSNLVGLVQHKPQRSFNDTSEGDDQLKVKAEMDALADTLLLKETEAPLAVGILGGWGSGKSFAMQLLHKRMAEIRSMAASDDYVGHPYLIDFDAWTYAKSNLWSSLIQTILLELNRQLEREKKWAPGSSETLWQQFQKYPSFERGELDKQENELKAKRDELEKKRKDVIKNVDDAIEQEINRAIWQPILDILSKPFGKSWKFWGTGEDSSNKVDSYAFRSWIEFSAFAVFAVVSILLPTLIKQFQQFQYAGMLLAIGSVSAEILRTFDQWKKGVDDARTEIRKSRDARISDKLEEEKATFTKIDEEIKTLVIKVADARRLAGVTATFGSLLELCQARLRQADYENELGLMHRVKMDLDEMDWAIKKAQELPKDDPSALFPRGKPRIVLFIDDLDRCPPYRVVEVLEATQLLLKTELFVVVLAMDVRYVTRALEKAYQGILARQGDPSGLDYIEKIIQIPYQVRPIDLKVVDDYISSMMTMDAAVSQEMSGVNDSDQGPDAEASPENGDAGNRKPEGGSSSKPRKVSKPRTLPPISQVVAFSKDEHDFTVLCCQTVDLTPRAIKRLINVYKILKILWSREPQWSLPEPAVEQAIVLLLTLSCAYPDGMREVFSRMANEIHKNNSKQNLSNFFAKKPRDGMSKLSEQEWRKMQDDLKNLWADKNKLKELKALPVQKIRDVLFLVRSFSFVGDIGYEPDIDINSTSSGADGTDLVSA